MRMKQKLFFLKKKKESKWPTKKKAHFPAPPILNIFLQKFYGLVLWLVELIDAKGIGMAQSAVRRKLKNIFCVFRLFLALCQTASRPYRF